VISSNQAFHLEALPNRVLIQGAAMSRSNSHHLQRPRRAGDAGLSWRQILRGFDEDLRAHLRAEMEKRGIRIVTGKTVAAVEQTPNSLRARLSTAARSRSTRSCLPPAAVPMSALRARSRGVRLAPMGASRWTGFANQRAAYSCGRRCHNRINLTPVAIREGHAYADTSFGDKPTRVDHADVPTAVFSEPELGTIGLTQAEACARLAKVDIYKTMFRPMKASLAAATRACL